MAHEPSPHESGSFEFSEEDIKVMLASDFTDAELKALCRRRCRVEMNRRNILYAIEKKWEEMNGRRKHPKVMPPDFPLTEFYRKYDIYCQTQATWEENHRDQQSKRAKNSKLEALAYLMVHEVEDNCEESVGSLESSQRQVEHAVEIDLSSSEAAPEVEIEANSLAEGEGVMYTPESSVVGVDSAMPACTAESEESAGSSKSSEQQVGNAVEMEADTSQAETLSEADSTESDLEEVLYTQDTDASAVPMQPAVPECAECAVSSSDDVNEFLGPAFISAASAAVQTESESTGYISGAAVQLDSESTEHLNVSEGQQVVTNSQEANSQEGYKNFTGTLTNKLSSSQVTSTQTTEFV